MKASELRIGNLFNPVVPTKVEGWMLHEDCQIEFNPIELTDEWLEKFGFTRDEELEKYDKSLKQFQIGKRMSNNFYRICWHIKGGYTFSIYGNPIYKPKYVHQLQNLYFLLAESELECNH